MGDLICLCSAVFYSLYTTSIAHFLPNSDGDSVMLFFGYIGCLGLVFLSPVILIFDFAGVEHVAMISSWAFALIVIKGLFDNVLSDALWTMALVDTTVATVGLSLTIPIGVAELFIRQRFNHFRLDGRLWWLGFVLSTRTSIQRQQAP